MIEPAAREDAPRLAEVINAAYEIGERGLWLDGHTRTNPAEVEQLLRDGTMLAVREDGGIAGCAHLRPIDDASWDLGLISVAPEAWGGGLGRLLIDAAETHMRAAGVTTVQLEVLVPLEGTHPEKVKLRAWYERLGYAVVRTAPMEEMAPRLAGDLAVPCQFLIFHKALT